MSKVFFKELSDLFAGINDSVLVGAVLGNLLAPKELEEVAKRYQIFKMLNRGVPQREIAKKLGVSIGTISRGSRELQYGNKGIIKVLSNVA